MQAISQVGGVTAAVLHMERLDQETRRRAWRRERLDGAIRALDALIEKIEQLNLDGRSRVPMAWQPMLARVASELPVETGDRLRAGISPQRLLDQVYDIQQEVFWEKNGTVPDDLEVLPRVS